MSTFTKASLKTLLCSHIARCMNLDLHPNDFSMSCIRPRVGFTHGFEITTIITTDFLRIRVYIQNTTTLNRLSLPSLESDDQAKVGPADNIQVVLGYLNLGVTDYCSSDTVVAPEGTNAILFEDGGRMIWEDGGFILWE